MLWIHTGRVIASVKNPHITRDLAMMQAPRHAVGMLAVAIDRNESVTPSIETGSPWPALVRASLINFLPKPLSQWTAPDTPELVPVGNHDFFVSQRATTEAV